VRVIRYRGVRSPVSGFPFGAGKRGTRAGGGPVPVVRARGGGGPVRQAAQGRQGRGRSKMGKPEHRLTCSRYVATLYLVEGADTRREAR